METMVIGITGATNSTLRGMDLRLPLNDHARIANRDLKLRAQEERRFHRLGLSRSRCPCRICLWGRPLLLKTQGQHLIDYGRHTSKRGWVEGDEHNSSDDEWTLQ